MKQLLMSGALCILAVAGFAHSGVQNEAVLERMDAMKTTGDALKVIGNMAKGTTTFDAAAARMAAEEIAREADRTPDLFEARETDPKSETKPAIWKNFEDFTAKAKTLETVAQDVSTSLETRADLGPAMASLGEACKSCHTSYRE